MTRLLIIKPQVDLLSGYISLPWLRALITKSRIPELVGVVNLTSNPLLNFQESISQRIKAVFEIKEPSDFCGDDEQDHCRWKYGQLEKRESEHKFWGASLKRWRL